MWIILRLTGTAYQSFIILRFIRDAYQGVRDRLIDDSVRLIGTAYIILKLTGAARIAARIILNLTGVAEFLILDGHIFDVLPWL